MYMYTFGNAWLMCKRNKYCAYACNGWSSGYAADADAGDVNDFSRNNITFNEMIFH